MRKEDNEKQEKEMARIADIAEQAERAEFYGDEKTMEFVEALMPLDGKSIDKGSTDNNTVPLQTLRVNGGEIKTSIELSFLKREYPDFSVGDTVRVHFKIREGDKERVQVYEGVIISLRGEANGRSFVVRRMSSEVGVERIFPYYSPAIQKIELVRTGRVRRAQLYYLRGKSGKEGRIKETYKNFVADELNEKIRNDSKTEQPKEAENVTATVASKATMSSNTKKGGVAKSTAKVSKTVAKKSSKKVAKKVLKKVSKKAIQKSSKKATKKTSKKVASKKK